jgi:hypothetical protein
VVGPRVRPAGDNLDGRKWFSISDPRGNDKLVGVNVIPDIVTHNFDPTHGPFGNLCALAPAEAARIFDTIRASGRRRLKPDYLERRLATERRLHEEATRKLGPLPLRHPVYFFLGDFDDGMDASRPSSLVLPLAHFPLAAITFTWPDSMASLPLATKAEHAADRQPYHGDVFTFDEIKAAIVAFGMPAKQSHHGSFIEMQLWDDEPLKSLSARSEGFGCTTKSPSVRLAGGP